MHARSSWKLPPEGLLEAGCSPSLWRAYKFVVDTLRAAVFGTLHCEACSPSTRAFTSCSPNLDGDENDNVSPSSAYPKPAEPEPIGLV